MIIAMVIIVAGVLLVILNEVLDHLRQRRLDLFHAEGRQARIEEFTAWNKTQKCAVCEKSLIVGWEESGGHFHNIQREEVWGHRGWCCSDPCAKIGNPKNFLRLTVTG